MEIMLALWNANGMASKWNELCQFDWDNRVFLLTKTELIRGVNVTYPCVNVHRTDRRGPGEGFDFHPRGGNSILVCSNLTHRDVITNTRFESTGVHSLLETAKFNANKVFTHNANGAWYLNSGPWNKEINS